MLCSLLCELQCESERLSPIWQAITNSGGQPSMTKKDQRSWRKSSFSGHPNTSCVEVAFVAEAVGVRDSKNTDGPQLAVPQRRGTRS
jgi:Domain of unknown function (DUF397)